MGHFTYEFGQLPEPSLTKSLRNQPVFTPASLFVPAFVTGVRSGSSFHLDQLTGNQTGTDDFFDRLRAAHPDIPAGSNHRFTGNEPEANREAYYRAFDQVRHHLLRGDVYELNYCLPLRLEGKIPDPAGVWLRMQAQQDSPMAALYRHDDAWLLCCSPERFIKKNGNNLITQPIKGTRPRGSDVKEDQSNREELYHSEKERAENVMIVDLARNDLGRVARTGSVVVEELFGIHSFPAVHQMISTVSAELRTGITFTDILKALFPMGSMTGAPKIRAMEIIRETEPLPRGLFSGTVGYIDPDGDFDFNVVIRSILYDDNHGTILYPAGSAITAYSDPAQEFEECLLKARGMRKVLGI